VIHTGGIALTAFDCLLQNSFVREEPGSDERPPWYALGIGAPKVHSLPSGIDWSFMTFLERKFVCVRRSLSVSSMVYC